MIAWWGQIILLVLQLLDRMVAYGQQQKWINQGKDEEIAKQAVEVLRKTDYAKRAMEEAAAMSTDTVDKRLRDLEG